MEPIAHTQDGTPIYGPQLGPQTEMITSSADIVIGGGAAGGGKSVWLLMEGAKGVNHKDFTGIIFRRQYNDVIAPGGIWDTSIPIYKAMNGSGVRGKTVWNFPAESTIKIGHLNNEGDLENHQGPAYAYIGFDELTQFTKKMFFYLLGRNRNFGSCKIRPYLRASCNPDADSWVAELIQWWWNPETGYPIPERQGVIRHFARDDDTDEIEWVSPDYRDINGDPPTSITFIASMLEDNKLMPNLAQYRSGVMKQDRVNRERLSKGNWLISYRGGMFDPGWFGIVDSLPEGIKLVRYWDMAATEPKINKNGVPETDPDWTSGGKMGIHDGVLYIADINAFRETPGKSEIKMRDTAKTDGREVEIYWEEEKASAGKFTSEYLSQVFKGYSARPDPVKGAKEERASKWAGWAEFERVRLLRGDWNKSFLAQAGKFPLGKRDQIDCISGGFQILVGPKPIVEYYNPTVHVSNFNKEKEEFNKIQPQNVSVYIVLWMEETGGVYGGVYLWSHAKRKLKIYNEIFQPYPITRLLAEEIIEKAIVQLEPQDHFVTVRKIFCNELMAKKGKSNVKKDLMKYGIRIFEGTMYDEHSGIFRVNKMFADNTITIHSECIETDVQLRRMCYENKKIPNGYPLVRSLLMIEAHIKDEIRKSDQGVSTKAYSAKKTELRERMREGKQDTVKKVSEYEHLM